MIDRKLKQALRASILPLSDAALTYLREEVQREQNRRRLQTRQRRAVKREGSRMVHAAPAGAEMAFFMTEQGLRALVSQEGRPPYLVDPQTGEVCTGAPGSEVAQ